MHHVDKILPTNCRAREDGFKIETAAAKEIIHKIKQLLRCATDAREEGHVFWLEHRRCRFASALPRGNSVILHNFEF